MKPLPSPKSTDSRAAAEKMPSLPTALPASSGSYSKANRRVGASPSQRAYPWLLLASTATAAVFCLMYVTKPVIVAGGNDPQAPGEPQGDAKPGPDEKPRTLLPSNQGLPGEANPDFAGLQPPVTSSFEETNLRIQHILSAEAPGGHSSRIDLEVPVLYQSRQLRWTTDEVAEARDLLVRLTDYQEKSRALRSEGVALLDSWNSLLDRSLPTDGLRADSPSLPSNQADGAPSTAAGVTSAESIQYEPSGQ